MQSDILYPLLTRLVRDRLRHDKRFSERAALFAPDVVEQHLQLDKLSSENLVKLVKVLSKECVFYNMTPDDYTGTPLDAMSTRQLIDTEYVSVGIDQKKTEFRLACGSENNDFKRLLTTPPAPSPGYAEIFVTFNIDKMAKDNLTSFHEIEVVKRVCNDIFEGLELTADIKSLPVKTPRRKEGSGVVWCQIRYDLNTNVLGEKALEYARNELSIKGLSERTRLRVYFAIKDSVEGGYEWGSSPLLHVGTNFKTEDFSQVVYDSVHSSHTTKENIKIMRDNPTPCLERETCGVYSQKGTTLEVPSKLDEINTINRLSLEESDALFFAKGEVSDELLINLAFAHPKARIRQLITSYVTCVFAKERASFIKTHINKHAIINVGRDVVLEPPSEESGYRISRKVCLSTDLCFACDNEKCGGHGHLSHDTDLSYNSNGGQSAANFLTNAGIKTLHKSKDYTMTACERAAMSHTFFCKGVRVAAPVGNKTYPFARMRRIFNVYGKVRDVVSTNRNMETAWRTKSRLQQQTPQDAGGGGENLLRKRVFYRSKEDLKNAEVVDRLSMAAFRDILYKEVDIAGVEHFFNTKGMNLMGIDWHRVHKSFGCFMEELNTIKYTENERLNKLYVDYATTIAPESKVKKNVYGDSENIKNALMVLRILLRALRNRNSAALFTLMNKSMLTESTLVLMGTRCAITDFGNCHNMTVRQFVCASKDMEVSLVDDDDLEAFTVVSGAVSATTAPNDTITDSACQTWRNNDTTTPASVPMTFNDSMYSSSNSVDDSSRRGRRTLEDNRGVVGGLIGDYRSFTTNQRRPATPSSSHGITTKRNPGKYLPPQLRGL